MNCVHSYAAPSFCFILKSESSFLSFAKLYLTLTVWAWGLFQKFCNLLAATLRAAELKDKHLIHPVTQHLLTSLSYICICILSNQISKYHLKNSNTFLNWKWGLSKSFRYFIINPSVQSYASVWVLCFSASKHWNSSNLYEWVAKQTFFAFTVNALFELWQHCFI